MIQKNKNKEENQVKEEKIHELVNIYLYGEFF